MGFLDYGKADDLVYLDFGKPSEAAPHGKLILVLENTGIDASTGR